MRVTAAVCATLYLSLTYTLSRTAVTFVFVLEPIVGADEVNRDNNHFLHIP